MILTKKIPRNTSRTILILLTLLLLAIDSFSYTNILRLTAASGSNSDETIVRLHEEATFDFDPDWDALKLPNGGNTPDFYTVIDEMDYAINSLYNDFESESISLNLKVAFNGSYSISSSGLETFDSSYSVILEDKLLHTQQNLRENSLYEFNASTTDSVNRFVLHIEKISPPEEIIITPPLGQDSVVTPEEPQVNLLVQANHIYISFINPSTERVSIGVSNTSGKKVFAGENIPTSSVAEIPLENMPGGSICIVRIFLSNQTIYKKIALN